MKRLRNLSLVCLLFFLVAATSDGAIDLVTDRPVGSPLVMDAGTVSSDTMTVSINSDALDLISGWQTTLWILPTGGTGDVGFNSSFQPVNYVFGTRQLYSEDLSFPVNNDGMIAFDTNFSGQLLPPVQVPGPPGLNLNDLNFIADAGASGLFGVFAVGGAGKSEWTPDGVDVNLFANIDPAFDSHTQIGEILVRAVDIIPEPASLLIWSVIGCVGLTCIRRRRTR